MITSLRSVPTWSYSVCVTMFGPPGTYWSLMSGWWLALMACAKATLSVMWLRTMTGRRDSCQTQHHIHMYKSKTNHFGWWFQESVTPHNSNPMWQKNGVKHYYNLNSGPLLCKLLSWVMTILLPSLLGALSCVSSLLLADRLRVYVRLTLPRASLA